MVTYICNVLTCVQIPKVFSVCVISNTCIEHCHLSLFVEIQQFGSWLFAHCVVKIDTC
jgi:hypothetical protein